MDFLGEKNPFEVSVVARGHSLIKAVSNTLNLLNFKCVFLYFAGVTFK